MSGLRDQSGFTMAELLMSMAVSLVILTAILAMTSVATHNQDRIASRVAANQRARPALTNMLDRLHSACVAPGIAPIKAGSSKQLDPVPLSAGLRGQPDAEQVRGHAFGHRS